MFQPNGFYPDTWNPAGEGRQCELPRVLKPFEAFRDRMTVLHQLDNRAKQHAGNVTALLTGHQAEPDAETGRHRAAKSIHQMIADRIAGHPPCVRSRSPWITRQLATAPRPRSP